MFSGYIFDVEGTLVDSVPQNLRSLQKALDQAGLQVPYATLQLYSGLDGDQTLQIIEPGLGEAQRKQILRKYKERSTKPSILQGSKPLTASGRCLRRSLSAAARLPLRPTAKAPELKHYLSLLDVDAFIKATACGDDVEHGKPDPRLVGLALEKIGPAGLRGCDGRRYALRRRGGFRSRHRGGGRADGWVLRRRAQRSGLLRRRG